MKKVLLIAMLGALVVNSDVLANAKMGTVSGKIGVGTGLIFLSGVSVNGKTAVGGLNVTKAVAANTHVDNGSVLSQIAKCSDPTIRSKRRFGTAIYVMAGESYWCSDTLAIGMDFDLALLSAKVKDAKTRKSSKIANSFSMMPTATLLFTDKLVLNFGLGITWTKVNNIDYVPDMVSSEVTNANVAGAKDEMVLKEKMDTFFATPQVDGKFINQNVRNSAALTDQDTFTVQNQLNSIASAINSHNESVIKSNKSFKTKPCFSAKFSVSYIFNSNSLLGVEYRYTSICTKTADGGEHQFKNVMHTIMATYTYHFNI